MQADKDEARNPLLLLYWADMKRKSFMSWIYEEQKIIFLLLRE